MIRPKPGRSWFRDIAIVTLEWFNSYEDALAAESEAIRTERPLHNVRHNTARLEAAE